MYERSFDEMIAYFNRRVSEMDISQDYKMELLGMVTALGYKHEKSAQPERKTGKWIQKEDPYGFFDTIPVCSECGHTTKMRETYKFCPNCGARMEDET